MSTTTVAAPNVQMIPTLKIVSVSGTNPRGNFSHEDPDFLQLKESIAERGLETPIKVGPAEVESGDELLHPVIWGHRRFAACLELGFEEIPAIIDEVLDEKGRFLAALSENLDRADMTPLAEARALRHLRGLGMKQADAAKAMRMSERSARDREKLLDIPLEVGQAISGGEIPLEGIPHFASIAAACPNAAQAIVDRAQKGRFPYGVASASALKSATAVGRMLGEVAEEAGLVKIVPEGYWNQGVHFDKLPIDEEARKKLKPTWEAMPTEYNGARPTFKFDQQDAKAAKKAGALLEFEGTSYITDPDLVARLAEKKLPAMAKHAEEIQERRNGGQSAEDRKKQQEREARKRKREEEICEGSNKQLADLLGALSKPKATDVDVVRLICAMALGQEHYLDELISEGLGVLAQEKYGWDEDGDGEIRRSPEATVCRELAKAKSAPECLLVTLRVALANRFVMAPGESASNWGFPGPMIDELNVTALIDDLGEQLGVLPEPVQKRVKARRTDREKAAKKRQEEADKAKAAAPKALQMLAKHPGQSTPDLAHMLHVSSAALRQVLCDLESSGGLKRDERGGWRLADDEEAKPELSEQQTDVLERIKKEPGIVASKLAKDAKVKQNALYRIVGDLEKAGLITKDGRKYTAVASV